MLKKDYAAFHVDEETERKIDGYLSKMTLTEKIGQMTQRGKITEKEKSMVREGKIGSFLNLRGPGNVYEMQRIAVEESRLGIPLIIGDDVIHGYRTIFPIPLAEACSWDPELIEDSAAIAAREASSDGINWIFSPMIDIARDPRWGRIAEGPGEDTYLAEVIARAKVHGLQKNELGERKIAACPKHFAAYGLAEAGRDYNTVDVSHVRLYQTHLPPFRAALEAGAATFMSAFHDLNGVPCTGNHWLLTEVLQEQWGFLGFVVSDWSSIDELVQHGKAATCEEAAVQAANAGTHMDMHSFVYDENLADAAAKGLVSEEKINDAVRRILRVKFQLGLFDEPYPDQDLKEKVLLNEKHRQKARENARKSIVLLKNNDKLLPLNKEIDSLAVIGPIADSQWQVIGCWGGQGRQEDAVSVLQGIQQKLGPNTKLHHSHGCDIDSDDTNGIKEAVEIAKKSDVAVMVVGETSVDSGENRNRTSLDLPGVQQELLEAVQATGTPVVMVLMNGRPLAISWEAEHLPAILETWHLGIEAGNAVADVLFGDYNPSGKLPVTFPRTVGQVPIYYNEKKTGRPGMKSYQDCEVTPLYPFGYGLSYTQFDYQDLQLSQQEMTANEPLTVSADIVNKGNIEGEETVQMYIGDVASSLTRPEKELKGFKKVFLKPQESQRVSFTITPEQLGFYNEKGHFIVEPGEFRVWIGPNSAEGLETAFELRKEKKLEFAAEAPSSGTQTVFRKRAERRGAENNEGGDRV